MSLAKPAAHNLRITEYRGTVEAHDCQFCEGSMHAPLENLALLFSSIYLFVNHINNNGDCVRSMTHSPIVCPTQYQAR